MAIVGRTGKVGQAKVRAWLTPVVALSLALATAGFDTTPAYAATEVRIPLPSGVSANPPFAVFGANMVYGSSRSTNAGATWTTNQAVQWPKYVGEGKVVGYGYSWQGAAANIFDVSSGTTTEVPLPEWPVFATATQALFHNATMSWYSVYTYATDSTASVTGPGMVGVSSSTAQLTGAGDVVWIGHTSGSTPLVQMSVAPSSTLTAGPWVSLGVETSLANLTVTTDSLLYVRYGSAGADFCSRPLASPATETCTTALSGDQTTTTFGLLNFGSSSVVLTTNASGAARHFIWTGASAAPVQVPSGYTLTEPAFSQTGRYGDTPYVLIRDSLGAPTLRKVNADGSVSAGVALPAVTAVELVRLQVALGRVVWSDNRNADEQANAWTRSVSGSGFGAESMLPHRASDAGASAGRMLALGPTGLISSDRGTDMATIPTSEFAGDWRFQISGPYILIHGMDAIGKPITSVYDAKGTKITTPGTGALFGSRLVDPKNDPDPAGRMHVTITDITGRTPPITRDLPAGTARFENEYYVWGDLIAFNDYGGTSAVYDLTTGVLVRELPNFFLSGLGDGYVTGWSGTLDQVIALNSGTVTTLSDSVNRIANDGVGHVAYTTQTELVWRDFSSLSTSPARVLGILAPSSFDATAASPVMKIDIDTTKALLAGSLQIKDPSGTVVRTIATPASADGSLRLQWDGKNAAGIVVPSGAYTYTLLANGADGSGAVKAIDGTSAVTGSVAVTGIAAPSTLPGGFVSVSPVRILDTRFGVGGFSGPVGANQSLSLSVAGNGGVPATGASAVVLNVTVVAPQQAGNITAYPSDASSVPVVSNLNFVAGQVVPNLVTVKLGVDGKIKLANQSQGATYLIADVAGYYVAGAATEPGAFVPVSPVRLLDTRDGTGTGGPAGPVAPAGVQKLKVTGVGGVPASNVAAVVLNVTEVAPTKAGNITVYPSDSTVPVASNLNFLAGDVRPNLVTVKVSADGFVSLANQSTGATHLLADVAGYYLAGTPTKPGMFVPVTPTRLLDTRFGPGPVGSVAAQASITLAIAGNTPVPATGVGAVVLNVTEVSPQQAGNITVYPSDAGSVPVVSNLNFLPGDAYPNLVIVKVGAVDGKVMLANQSAGSTYLIADVGGYFLK